MLKKNDVLVGYGIRPEYALMISRAQRLLGLALGTNKDDEALITSAWLCCTFALEGYANHIGEYWAKKEGNKLPLDDKFPWLSTREKLRILYKHYGLAFDVSKKPFKTAKILFDARSGFTHPRTTKIEAKLSIEEELDGDGISGTFDLSFPAPRTLTEATEALEDCKEIIQLLHDRTGEKENSPADEDPFSPNIRVYLNKQNLPEDSDK